MRVYYNRVSREAWLASNIMGPAMDRLTANPREKMVDTAGRLMTKHGFARTSDFMLVADGSPMRYANVVKAAPLDARQHPDIRVPQLVPAEYGRGTTVHLSTRCGATQTYAPKCGVFPASRRGIPANGPVTCLRCKAIAAKA